MFEKLYLQLKLNKWMEVVEYFFLPPLLLWRHLIQQLISNKVRYYIDEAGDRKNLIQKSIFAHPLQTILTLYINGVYSKDSANTCDSKKKIWNLSKKEEVEVKKKWKIPSVKKWKILLTTQSLFFVFEELPLLCVKSNTHLIYLSGRNDWFKHLLLYNV